MNVQEDLERVCYGYKGILYISVILIGLGIIGIALGITLALLTYPIWVLVVFWALGVILLASGIFWHVTMGFTYDTQKMGSIKDGFLDAFSIAFIPAFGWIGDAYDRNKRNRRTNQDPSSKGKLYTPTHHES